MIVTNGWSWRLRPTPGRSWRTSTPAARRSSAGPTPLSSNSCGDWMAPAQRMTSRSARTTVDVGPAAAGAHADPDGALAVEVDAEHLHARAHGEVLARQHGA